MSEGIDFTHELGGLLIDNELEADEQKGKMISQIGRKAMIRGGWWLIEPKIPQKCGYQGP